MSVIYILWLRQIKRYFRSKARIIGAIGQPLLFLLALGYGLGSVYKRAGGGNYIEFLVPGVMAQTVLFAGMFFGMNILFDKRFGFLSELLVAPVSRFRIIFGNALGGATNAVFQASIVFIISLFLGFRPHNWLWLPLVLVVMYLISMALASLSAGIAAMVSDFQGFQSINNLLVFPLYFLSGALYPLSSAPTVLKIIGYINPLSYAVDAMRFLLIHQSHFSFLTDLIALSITFVVAVAFGINRFNKIQV